MSNSGSGQSVMICNSWYWQQHDYARYKFCQFRFNCPNHDGTTKTVCGLYHSSEES